MMLFLKSQNENVNRKVGNSTMLFFILYTPPHIYTQYTRKKSFKQ